MCITITCWGHSRPVSSLNEVIHPVELAYLLVDGLPPHLPSPRFAINAMSLLYPRLSGRTWESGGRLFGNMAGSLPSITLLLPLYMRWSRDSSRRFFNFRLFARNWGPFTLNCRPTLVGIPTDPGGDSDRPWWGSLTLPDTAQRACFLRPRVFFDGRRGRSASMIVQALRRSWGGRIRQDASSHA